MFLTWLPHPLAADVEMALACNVGSRKRWDRFERHSYFFSAACAPGFRRPTANHAASRHFPCCFTQTVINWLLTSAILPLLLALRWMRLSITAESPLYERT